MRRRTVLVAGVASLSSLAGCAGLTGDRADDGGEEDSSPSTTASANNASATNTTSTPTNTQTQTTAAQRDVAVTFDTEPATDGSGVYLYFVPKDRELSAGTEVTLDGSATHNGETATITLTGRLDRRVDAGDRIYLITTEDGLAFAVGEQPSEGGPLINPAELNGEIDLSIGIDGSNVAGSGSLLIESQSNTLPDPITDPEPQDGIVVGIIDAEDGFGQYPFFESVDGTALPAGTEVTTRATVMNENRNVRTQRRVGTLDEQVESGTRVYPYPDRDRISFSISEPDGKAKIDPRGTSNEVQFEVIVTAGERTASLEVVYNEQVTE